VTTPASSHRARGGSQKRVSHSLASEGTLSPGHRDGSGGGHRKKVLSTAERLDEMEQLKRQKSRSVRQIHKRKVERPPEAEIVRLDDVQPMGEMLAPMGALVERLTTWLEEERKRLQTLRVLVEPSTQGGAAIPPEGADGAKATPTAEVQSSAEPDPELFKKPAKATMQRSRAQKVWHDLARHQLVQMASSLAGALLDESQTKLRGPRTLDHEPLSNPCQPPANPLQTIMAALEVSTLACPRSHPRARPSAHVPVRRASLTDA
jgi:hypothetical protein